LTAVERSRGRCGWCELPPESLGLVTPAPRYHHAAGLSLGKGIRGCCRQLAELVATADGWVCRGCGHETPAERGSSS
jgi:hypothetical protein